jgi:hypothetical protein
MGSLQDSGDGPAGDRLAKDTNKIPPDPNPSRIKQVFKRFAGQRSRDEAARKYYTFD